MKSFLLAAFLLTAASAFPADKPVAAEKNATAPTKAAPAKNALEKGTEAAAILKRFGQPPEIQPMSSPDPATKAERWIYRRKTDERLRQDHVNTTHEVHQFSAGTVNGVPRVQTTVITTPVIKTKLVITYQVTALLLVNGKLELAKQRQEQEEKF